MTNATCKKIPVAFEILKKIQQIVNFQVLNIT